MKRSMAVVVLVFGIALLPGCKTRKVADIVDNGAHGPTSPAESGNYGPDAYNRPPFDRDPKKVDAEHRTAGLTGPMTNGFDDPTMEDSGNIAWQGSYEREKRKKMSPARANEPPAYSASTN